VSWYKFDSFTFIRTLDNAGWSLLSLANVHFANSPTGGYFANPVPNPFLHFWSLSVEEQFYVALPLLLLLVGLLKRRWSVPVLIGLVFLASLTASVLLSATNDPNAFYSLGTRAWELAIGAGLAWFTSFVRSNPPQWARVAGFVLGLAGIVVAAGTFNSAIAWPGSAALLPTVGTALVIWAGTGGSAGWITRVLDNPVARYIGDVSFSFYLWHWPVLVLMPNELQGDPLFQFLAVLFAFGLAALTYHFVEQPFQRMRPAARPWRILAVGLPAAVAVSATAFAGAAALMPNSGLRVEPLAAQYETLSDGPGSVPEAVPVNVRPSLLDVGYDLQPVYRQCFAPGLPECWSGDPDGDQTVLVTGDSFAGMFWPSIEQAARDRGWRVVIVAKAGCSLLAPRALDADATQDELDCMAWRGQALDRAEAIRPDVILYVNSMGGIADDRRAEWITDAKGALQRLAALAPVVVLGPTPIFPFLTQQCMEPYFFDPSACSRPLDEVVKPSTRDLADEVAGSVGADVLDLNGILCDRDGVCPMLVADTFMYRDSGHISNVYSTHFVKIFGDVLGRYLRD
jgi:peptidoglycan/LPS O-acetylase OafA/YrhL